MGAKCGRWERERKNWGNRKDVQSWTCMKRTCATFSFQTSCSLQNSTDLRKIWAHQRKHRDEYTMATENRMSYFSLLYNRWTLHTENGLTGAWCTQNISIGPAMANEPPWKKEKETHFLNLGVISCVPIDLGLHHQHWYIPISRKKKKNMRECYDIDIEMQSNPKKSLLSQRP